MELYEEIYQAAQALGSSLRDHPDICAYLDAKTLAESDPDVVALEQRLEKCSMAYAAPQESGKPAPSLESGEYFALRTRARYYPLISAREAQLSIVKDIFAGVGSEINNVLGLDYAAMLHDSK